jgi:YHS domain-containing protein
MLSRRAFAALTVVLSLSALNLPVFAKEKIYTGLLSGAAVGGYDPVAYFKKGQPVEGLSEFTTEWNGATWYFESEANKAEFVANPAAFAPQYGGHCAWAVAQGQLAKGDPSIWKIVDGKLYLNYNQDVQGKWQADIPGFIKGADASWPKIGQE